MAQMNNETKLAAARLVVRSAAPYFRSVLLKLRPKEVPTLNPPTMAVTTGLQLLYHPGFVAALTVEETAFVLLHEVLHVWNKHAARRGLRDPKMWNYAGDLANNCVLVQIGGSIKMPSGELRGLMPSDYGFKDGLSADEYYALLQALPKPPEAQNGPCTGQCGSGAGHAHPGEAEHADAGDDVSEVEAQRAVKTAAEAIVAAGQGRGTVPAGLLREAREYMEPAVVPWTAELSAAVRTAVQYRPGSSAPRYDMPSKRQSGCGGYGMGRPILPRYRSPVPQVAVGIDTSGSMDRGSLEHALDETGGILKALAANVHLVTCDASAAEPVKISSVANVRLVGGGGTDFRPLFESLDKMQPRPEVFVFFTDCDGPWPDVPPRGVRTVVVRLGRYLGTPPDWCKVIEYKELTKET